jgi:shikimate dehydrogenase
MGQPVAGNPTQYMMEKAFAAARLDWRYLTLEVSPADLADAVRGMRAMGFRGANFTIPHKVAVLPLLDSLSEAAGLMGAVNCVVRDEQRLVGENTDGKGFVASLQTQLDPKGKRIVVLGAGGAARAIAVELGLSGAARIDIVNRSLAKAQELSQLLTEKVKVESEALEWKGDFVAGEGVEIVVNATSVGLGDAEARVPLDLSSLAVGSLVADVVFNPPRTRLIVEAAERGLKTLDGLGMLVNQAVIGFKNWTGIDPDAGVMRDALEEFLEL